MKKILSVLLCSLFLVSTGCDNNEKEKPQETETLTKKEGFSVGDIVIARWSGKIAMYEGKIEKLGDKMTIKWSDGTKASEVEQNHVFAKPVKGTKSQFNKGDWVFTHWKSGTKWYGSKVLSVGEQIEIQYVSDATTTKVPSHDVIQAPQDTHGELDKALVSSQILRDAKAAGEPFQPADWKPTTGTEVVAVWSASTWYQGTVESINDNKATVKWKDNSKPSEVSKIVPLPTKEAPKAAIDDYVLIAPKRDTSFSTWQYGKVIAVDGDNVEIYIQDGNKRTVGAQEYLVIK